MLGPPPLPVGIGTLVPEGGGSCCAPIAVGGGWAGVPPDIICGLGSETPVNAGLFAALLITYLLN